MTESVAPLRVCVLGVGGGGFHRAAEETITAVKRPLELVLIFGAIRGGIRKWQSTHPIHTTYNVRSLTLVGDSRLKGVFFAVLNFVLALRIILAERPDLVLCVASSQGAAFGIAARLLRCPVWFVESWTRVHRPSRTGRLVYRLALSTRFFYCWPSLSQYYPQGTLLGGPR